MLNFLLEVVNAGVVGDRVNSTGSIGTIDPIKIWFEQNGDMALFVFILGMITGILSCFIIKAIIGFIKFAKNYPENKENQTESD